MTSPGAPPRLPSPINEPFVREPTVCMVPSSQRVFNFETQHQAGGLNENDAIDQAGVLHENGATDQHRIDHHGAADQQLLAVSVIAFCTGVLAATAIFLYIRK